MIAIAKACAHFLGAVLSVSCVISDLILKTILTLQKRKTDTEKLNNLLKATSLGGGGARTAQVFWAQRLAL